MYQPQLDLIDGYLLDTPIASALFDAFDAKHETAVEHLDALGEGLVFMSTVTLGEIEYGVSVYPSVSDDRLSDIREAARMTLELLTPDREVAITYGQIRASIFKTYGRKSERGRVRTRYPERLVEESSGLSLGIQENDLWIAATAVNRNLVLVTADHAGGMTRILDTAGYRARVQYWW